MSNAAIPELPSASALASADLVLVSQGGVTCYATVLQIKALSPFPGKVQSLAATSSGSVTLPANAYLKDIIVENTTANAITGGLKFGTTAGATDVCAALAVGASGLVSVTDALLLKKYFSVGSTQQIYFDAVTLWNSANVNITLVYWQL